MVKVTKISTNPINMEAKVSLFADRKTDVSDGMEIEGMMDGYAIGMGSTVITADAEFAFMKSDGTWNWI